MQTKAKMKMKWMLSGAMALGLTGYATSPLLAKPPVTEKPGEVERTISLDDVPRPVRKTFERERGTHQLMDLKVVKKENGEVFYRGYIEERGKQKWIRVTPDGEMKGEDVVREVRDRPAEVVRERPAEVREVRPTYARPEVVAFDDLPGHAKEAIGREAGAMVNRIKVYKSVTRAGMPIFSCEVGDGNRTRMITVDATGKVYNDVDDTRPGEKSVSLDELPYGPKSGITKEAGAGRVQRVIQGTDQTGHTMYTALVKDATGPFWVTVDDSGRIVAERSAK